MKNSKTPGLTDTYAVNVRTVQATFVYWVPERSCRSVVPILLPRALSSLSVNFLFLHSISRLEHIHGVMFSVFGGTQTLIKLRCYCTNEVQAHQQRQEHTTDNGEQHIKAMRHNPTPTQLCIPKAWLSLKYHSNQFSFLYPEALAPATSEMINEQSLSTAQARILCQIHSGTFLLSYLCL